MVLCALIGSRPKLTKILFSFLILTAYGCGTAPQSPVDSDPNDFSDEFVLSGEGGETLRTIHLSLAPGKTKRYRITTEQFTAKLTQTSQALAKLSAQHYSNRIDGESSMTPEIEVVAQDEYKVRNWTFRVHNLGEEPLEATIVVAVLPLNTEETPPNPNTEEASEVVETLRTIHLSLAPGKTKRYRITTEQFTAKLTQTSEVLAQLSAKHYSNNIASEPSLAPEIEAVAQDEYKIRNWTLRVHNLGEEQLEATIVVTTLPLVTAEIPTDFDTEVVFSPQGYYSSHLIKVIDALNDAQESVDIAMYSFSDASVRMAVADAVARGITVRMIFENGRTDVNSPEDSRSAIFEELGVDVRYINKIMHHKFAIIDGPQDVDDDPADAFLITGSGNWSYGAASKYDENTTFIKGHSRLVQSFQKEFNFIWENSRDFVWSEAVEYFETMPIEISSELSLETDGIEVAYTSDNFRTYTSSRYGKTFSVVSGRNTVANRVVQLIESAQSSIRIASGHMRSRPIAEAIIVKKQANPEMDIRVYLDGQEYVSISKHWQQIAKLNTCLIKAGATESKIQKCYDKGFYFAYEFQLEEIDIKFKHYAFRWNYSYALQMHHKYVIIDDQIVASGSYNFSDNAEHNTIENMVIYHSSHFPQLVQGFVENFESIWTTGTGKYEPLMETVETADEFPLVFDSMALSWTEVYNLKSLMAQHCEEIYSSEFRNNPTEHLTCVK